MQRAIEFYAKRNGKSEHVEISIPLDRLTPPAQNVAWVLHSTVKGRGTKETQDRLLVRSKLNDRELIEQEAATKPVSWLLNEGCLWLHSTQKEIQHYLNDPDGDKDARAAYMRLKLSTSHAYANLAKHPHTDWKLPVLHLEGNALPEDDVERALEYLEALTKQIIDAGGDTNNLEGAHRSVVDGECFYENEQGEAEIQRINRALFGGKEE